MARVLNIVETKLIMRNGAEVQRVIFSDDKIVYVRVDTGDVKPDTTPDKYVDLISTYNTTHTVSGEGGAGGHSQRFDHEDSDRQDEIDRAVDKRHLSKNRKTQSAINSVRDFGILLFMIGIIQAVFSILLVFFIDGEVTLLLGLILNMLLGAIYILLGWYMMKLKFGSGGVIATAVTFLILAAIGSGAGGVVGLLGFLAVIHAIIALCKVGRYGRWHDGEIE